MSACTGNLEGAAGPSGSGGGGAHIDDDDRNGRDDDGACVSIDSPGAPVPLKRLTAVQVRHTAEDVLGAAAPLTVPDERLATAFASNVSSSVDTVSARAYLDFAEATANAMDTTPCTDSACKGWLLDSVALRLFRRPLDGDERTRYGALYDLGVADGGAKEGAKWVVTALLASPTFLYPDEGLAEDGVNLSGTALATRLALTLWGANPDEALLAKAAAGELDDKDALMAEADRMLDDPRALRGMRDFVDQWLHLEKLDDPDTRPDLAALGDDTVAALREEPVLFVRNVVENGGGLTDLLTESRTAALEPLRAFYGDELLSQDGDTFVLDGKKRAGVLTLPGVMAALAHANVTSPTMRGHAILANVLCKPPLPPPAGLNVTVPPVVPGQTTRQRLESHFTDPTCAACHASMDGLGFAFEGFDWLGRSRTTDNDLPIDTKSDFKLGVDDLSVDGAVDLTETLSERADISSCVAKQWMRYTIGIKENTTATACLVEQLSKDLLGPGGLRQMMLTYVSSDWFRRGTDVSP